QVADQYVQYVMHRYELNVAVVFDGYSGHSTKDHEHARRSSKMAAFISISPETITHPNQQAFLANSNNKGRLIAFLISKFKAAGISVTQAQNDADTLIVRVALDFAAAGYHTTVVADDTDVLVMLVYHWHRPMADVFIKRESQGAVVGTTFSVPLVQEAIGDKT